MATSDSGVIETRRLIAAARERVWEAFSNPAALAQWWGPAGFRNVFHECDFRPGGVWRFTMHSPDGAAYSMDHRFEEIVPLDRLVVRHLQPGHDFTLTVRFAAQGDRTAVTWRMRFDDPAEAARIRPVVEPANEQNLDRLAALLSGTPSSVR
jgi:uncharacterized protein YndB with AHSA1/START domain